MTSKILNSILFGAHKTKRRALERRTVRKKRRTKISRNYQDNPIFLLPQSPFQSKKRRN